MSESDTTPLLETLRRLYAEAQRSGNQEALEFIAAQMRREQERIAAGIGERAPDPRHVAELYEDSDGTLYLVGHGLAVDVTSGAPDGFESDAVAVLEGETAQLGAPSYPASLLDRSALTRIAHYNGETGIVTIMRDAQGFVAGPAGRRYIGGLDEEDVR